MALLLWSVSQHLLQRSLASFAHLPHAAAVFAATKELNTTCQTFPQVRSVTGWVLLQQAEGPGSRHAHTHCRCCCAAAWAPTHYDDTATGMTPKAPTTTTLTPSLPSTTPLCRAHTSLQARSRSCAAACRALLTRCALLLLPGPALLLLLRAVPALLLPAVAA
jgi:hypothetical protein